MTKRIQNYRQLLDEKERLESLLKLQKAAVNHDIQDIKEQLEPVRSALSLAGKLVTRDSSNLLLNAGANTLIDLVVKKLILSKAGWITRLAVPFLVKNYSSHFISESKDAIINKLLSLFGKKKTNSHEMEYED
jgi:hypothetical protein